MSYTEKKIEFLSSDKKNTVKGTLYIPDGEVRCAVLLSHGMIDHSGRYRGLAEFLTEHGCAFFGYDHLGHGLTAKSAEDFGFFASRGGRELLTCDLESARALLSKEISGVPIVLFGHSMGSFIARLYATKYKDRLSAIIIHGTAGANPLLVPGRALVSLLRLIYGERHRSKLIKSLAEGAYEKAFMKTDGKFGWLTRDTARVADRDSDPRTSFNFTLAAYADLFEMLTLCNKSEWFLAYPKELPTLIMNGGDDPVGNFGRGTREVYKKLSLAGVKDLTYKEYEGARHELFFETNSDEVLSDIWAWIQRAVEGK